MVLAVAQILHHIVLAGFVPRQGRPKGDRGVPKSAQGSPPPRKTTNAQTIKRTNKQTDEQTNKPTTNKRAKEQLNKQTYNKHTNEHKNKQTNK